MAVSKDPFNKELDKITQAEVVYDFVERLSIGRDFNVGNYTFPANVKLRDEVIRKLYNLLPQSLVASAGNLNDAIKYHINKGATSINIEIDDHHNNCWLSKVMSDKTGMDIISIFKFEIKTAVAGGLHTYTLSTTFDTPYPYDDDITIYTRFN